jgi:hypothetical protein
LIETLAAAAKLHPKVIRQALRLAFLAPAVAQVHLVKTANGQKATWRGKSGHTNISCGTGTIYRFGCCEVSPSAAGSAASQSNQPQMIKSVMALATFALLGAAVIAIPGYAPQAKADEAVALAKADRLPIRLIVRSCSSQIWPQSSCLHDVGSGRPVLEARLIAQR